MKVKNMTNRNGNKIANQFIITNEIDFTNEEGQKKKGLEIFFQSHKSTIVRVTNKGWKQETTLDKKYWNYSATTSKYRNIFLDETKKETQTKIDNGEYKLDNLN